MHDSEWPVPKEEFQGPPPVDIGEGEHLTVRDRSVREQIIRESVAALQENLDAITHNRRQDVDEALQHAQEAVRKLRQAKEAVAAPPYHYVQPRLIIGLGGKLRSGKDTVADYLVEHHGFLKLGMSDDSLHQFVMAQNPWVEIQQPFLFYWTRRIFRRYRDVVNAQGYVDAKKNPDLRRLLQLTGTEAGRDVIGEDVWTGVILRKALAAEQPVVITGIRYQNEIEMIRELEGWAAWVDRPESLSKALDPLPKVSAPKRGRKALSEAPVASQHTSETALSAEWFDVVLENDSDLATLYGRADRLVRELKGIG